MNTAVKIAPGDAFLQRDCPVCGTSATKLEVVSERKAETMPLSELRRFWSGFFKEKVFFSYARCEGCGVLYTPSFFTDEQLADLYADMAPNMNTVTDDAIASTQAGYWQAVAGRADLSGGYLEIGPDVGYVVGHAAIHGRFDHFWLFEPNRAVHAQLAAAAKGRPQTILEDMVDLSPVPDGSVGLAVMVHVLDHLLDPVGMLRQIRSKLKPGGTLMIVTHNEQSLLRRVMGRKWPPFCLQHPEVYNPDSMKGLVRKAGFRDAEVQRSTNYFPIGFMARQAAMSVGIDLARVPLPSTAVGLKLGNMLTIATN